MAIPSREELLKTVSKGSSFGSGALSGVTRDNVLDKAKTKTASTQKINTLRSEAASAEAVAASAAKAAKPLNVIKGVAVDIARSIPTTLASTVAAAKGKSLSSEYTPTTSVDKFLLGDEPVSFRKTGEAISPLIEKIGVSPETASNIAPYVGLFVGALDFAGVPGKKAAVDLLADTTIKNLAKEASADVIYKVIKPGLKGADAETRSLAEAIAKVTDPREVKKLIEAATTPVPKVSIGSVSKERNQYEKLTVPSELQTYAQTLTESGYTKGQFLARLGRAISSSDTEISNYGKLFKQQLTEAGFTPGKFYDATHGIPTPRNPGGISGPAGLRRVGIAADEKMITRAESSLLRERIQNLSRGARGGAVAARKEVADVQREVYDLIKANLPPSLRGPLLATLRNADRPSKLDEALSVVDDHIIDYQVLKAQAKQLSRQRSNIGFVRKIAQLNQTAVNDVKRSLGIQKPLRKMTEFELRKVQDELVKRLRFKEEGNLLDRDAAPKSPTELSDAQIDEYAAALGGASRFTARAAKSIENAKAAITSGNLITIPSEALRAIGAEPVLTSLRKMGAQARKYTMEGAKPTSEIIEKLGLNKSFGKRVISDRDYAALDLAMKNGAIDTVMDIAEKYGVKAEFEQLRPIIDDVFKRANEVDLEVEYRQNFFPRSFKDDPATRNAATDYFEREYGDVLSEAYADFSTKMGRTPTAEERWAMINNLMRGFKQQGVTLSKTGSFKKRVVDTVTPATADFYQDSFSALQNYFESANNLIEARRFFGKHVDLKNIPPEAELKDVAGQVIDGLVARGQLNPKNSERLREILQARFTGGQMNGFLRQWKNMSYLTIMGDVISAVTQIGDFEKVMYRAGLGKTAPAIFNAVFNPSAQEIRLADLGLEKTIAAEMSTASQTARMVNQVFRAAGLSWVDRLGKEAFLNGVLSKYRTAVAAGDEEFLSMARRILGDEADETFADIARGENTENVKFLALNELADFFPVTLEEVPIQYLKSPNGRIFYTMKTFTTKQLNTYRREILEVAKKDKVTAAKNLARLVGFFVVMNMTADEIKGWIKGDEKSFSDKLVDNMLKTVGFGRYQLDQTQQQGFGRTLVEQALPPTTFIDDAVKDFNDAFVKRDLDKGLRSTRSIPLGGELYYWWFGRGATQNESPANKTTVGSTPQIPSVTIPSVNIPNITI